ncbi:sigma factor [Glycomyces albidus]|uniref:RNA polymerase sigma-70 region 2 domain-containing protein n=1 Tax=Glycomyces albidus TaxID=2656774 RepID=A0A6L5G940_9ACTN|nr:sigma factor [Glycomyces albidus]MQM26165.1 hypothetical protein [Glycomyces albidus]
MPKHTDQYRDRAPDDFDRLRPLFGELARLDEDDPEWWRCRERLITGYAPVVEHAVRKYAGRGADPGDLLEVGVIALAYAIDRFDPGSGGDFLDLAVPTVVGELSRYFHIATKREPTRPATGEHDQVQPRLVTPADVASRLGVSRIHVSEVLAALSRAQGPYEPRSDRSDESSDSALWPPLP